MRRALLFGAFLLATCGEPEDDSDLKAAFAASALKDPSSVQLRNVQANDHVICGEYNSKNSYGAYAGFEPFVFNRLIKDLWLGDRDNEYSHSAFWKDCPNLAQLGLNDGAQATDMNATDMNAVDMNATDMNTTVPSYDSGTDASEKDDEPEDIGNVSEQATGDNAEAYDANNDAGE